MGRAGLPERDLSQRKELFDAVKEMRTKGLSYNGIIAEVEKTRGVRLSRSHVAKNVACAAAVEAAAGERCTAHATL